MKILSAAPSNTEIIYKLGLQEKLVGTTSLCDHPRDAIKKPGIGGWNKGLKYRKIDELNPDIILLSDSLQNKQAQKLEKKGYDLLHVSPENLKQVYKSIQKIGRKFDKKQEASEIVQEMKKEINSTDLKNKRIYCEEWMEPPMVSGNWIPGLIKKANGNYFIDEERSREFDLEKLKKFDPEYIFLNVCGAGTKINPEKIIERPQWQEITAVKNENVYVIDDALLNRPTTRLIEGLKEIEENIEIIK